MKIDSPKIYRKLVCGDERVDKIWETGSMSAKEDNDIIYIYLHMLFKDGRRWQSKGYDAKTGHEHIDEGTNI